MSVNSKSQSAARRKTYLTPEVMRHMEIVNVAVQAELALLKRQLAKSKRRHDLLEAYISSRLPIEGKQQ